MRTASEVVREAYANPANDKLRLAVNSRETCVGSWDENLQRFVMVACATITGQWVELPFELLVNGKHVVEEWREIPRESMVRA